MALHDTVRTLANVPTFRTLDPEALRLIAFSAEMRILRAGDVLFREGEASDCGYVLLSGIVALAFGRKIMMVKAPLLIGDAALVAETMRPATGTAREPSSVLKISRHVFRRVISEYPDSAVRLQRSLVERVIMLQRDLQSAALNLSRATESAGKVARF